MSDFARDQGVSEAAEFAWRRKLAIMCRIVGLQKSIGLFGHISIRIPGTDVVPTPPGAGSEKTVVRTDQIFVFAMDGKIDYHPGGDRPMRIPAEWRIQENTRGPAGDRLDRASPRACLDPARHRPEADPTGFRARRALQGRRAGRDNPRLVVTDEMAASLSKALGDKRACQMRGHGSVVVGATPEACLLACTFIEENARYQIEGDALGGVVPLSPEEIADCSRGSVSGGLERLLWDYWERRVNVAGVPL